MYEIYKLIDNDKHLIGKYSTRAEAEETMKRLYDNHLGRFELVFHPSNMFVNWLNSASFLAR